VSKGVQSCRLIKKKHQGLHEGLKCQTNSANREILAALAQPCDQNAADSLAKQVQLAKPTRKRPTDRFKYQVE